MNDGYYWVAFNSYVEHGPFLTAQRCYENGVDETFYSTDFAIQEWRGGNMVEEWRNMAEVRF